MTKLKYILQEGEEILDNPKLEDLKDYIIIKAVVAKKPTIEKPVKTTKKNK